MPPPPGTSGRAEKVLARTLSRDPDARYPDAAGLVAGAHRSCPTGDEAAGGPGRVRRIDGSGDARAGGGLPLAAPEARFCLAEPAGQRSIPASHQLRRSRTLRRDLPRRSVRGVPLDARRAGRRLRHRDRDWHVPQRHPGRRAGAARQPGDSNDAVLSRRHPGVLLGGRVRHVERPRDQHLGGADARWRATPRPRRRSGNCLVGRWTAPRLPHERSRGTRRS